MRIRISELAASVRSFWRDTEGVMLPYVTVLLVVFVGMSVLALDGGRARSLHTQLQKGADALARAGAAELDRLPNSIDRATAAVNNLITNSSIFGTAGNQNVSAVQIRFMSTLPASDVSPITNVLCTAPGCTAAQAVLASYIEVTVTPTTMSTILPASFFGGTNSSYSGGRHGSGCLPVLPDVHVQSLRATRNDL
jgi:Flp pilus assembly protein TadG